jgi:hypothetical protein
VHPDTQRQRAPGGRDSRLRREPADHDDRGRDDVPVGHHDAGRGARQLPVHRERREGCRLPGDWLCDFAVPDPDDHWRLADAHPDADPDPDANADAHPDANADSHAHAYPHANAHAYPHANAHAYPDPDT